MLGPGAWPDVSQAPLGRGWRGGVPTKGRLGRRRRSWSSRPSRTLIMQRHLAARNAKVRISRGGPTKGTMVQRSLMLRSACSAPRGEKLRAPRSRNMGSETPEFQSMSYGDAQKLRWVFPGPLRDARLPLQRSQLLRLLARHGLKFWSLRPRLPTAKWSQFLSPWPGTCRTQHRISFDHRVSAALQVFRRRQSKCLGSVDTVRYVHCKCLQVFREL